MSFTRPSSRATAVANVERLEDRTLLSSSFVHTSLNGVGSRVEAVTSDAKGNIYVAGSFSGTVDFDFSSARVRKKSQGSTDVFVAKYSATGKLRWVDRYGGAAADKAQAIAVDAGGNVAVAGKYAASGLDSSIFLAKHDSAGNRLFKQIYASGFNRGATGVAFDADRKLYVTGTFSNTTTFGTDSLVAAGSTDAFLLKLNGRGGTTWVGGIGGAGTDDAGGIATDADGNVFLAGAFTGTADFDPGPGTANLTAGATGRDAFVAKYTPGGDYAWANKIGGDNIDLARDVAVDSVGNVYVAGEFTGSATAGSATLNSVGGSRDLFVAKYRNGGNFVLAKSMGGSGIDIAYGLAVDSSQRIYLAGTFSAKADFDPSSGTKYLTPVGSQNSYLVRLTKGGALSYVRQIAQVSSQNVGVNQIDALSLDPSGNVLLGGYFSGTTDFNPASGAVRKTSTGTDFFLLKLDPGGRYAT